MRLLVVLDRPDTAAFTLKTAGALGARLRADKIRILHPRPADNPAFQTPDEGMPTSEEQRRFAQDVAERADKLRMLASAWIGPIAAGVRHQPDKEWVEIAGDVRKIATQEALNADFVVHARPRAGDPGYVADAFAGILYDAEAALVVAPLQDYDTVGRRPVIGWHPSRALDNAIFAAMPLLETAEKVTFVIGEHEGGETGLPDFTHTLADRGVKIAVDRFQIESGSDLGEQIRAHALAAESDLLIMGAYTRPHFLEWLFGGPTQDVFAHATLPILTHH
ncbi:universal stress protein [Gluconobacter aidae]|uniref:Universal stress protein n=1 Tax=Gluconobacter aidae TaxID=2662454 RepID=A0A7X1SSR6_9PROT|nr:universal stress protein [Gluconobacter aidae]MQS00041.1 universal stress protein [Gluconobacter aidae]